MSSIAVAESARAAHQISGVHPVAEIDVKVGILDVNPRFA